jgi:acyl-CoA thioester hydrolase
MRIERAKLERGVFPYTCQVATRYSDLDQLGHVNNVAVAAIFQEGRNRFIRGVDLMGLARCDLVVAALNIEFASDLYHPDPIDLSVGILDIGRTSFRFGQIASQNGRIGAYAEVVQVARDKNGPIPLPDAWRAKLESLKIADSGSSSAAPR